MDCPFHFLEQWWWIVFVDVLTIAVSCKLQAVFQSAQNMSSDFVEFSCVVVATTTPKRHEIFSVLYKYWETGEKRIWKIYDYV